MLAIDMLRAGYAKAYVPDAGGAALARLHAARGAAPLLRRVARRCARSTAGASPPRRGTLLRELRGELGARAARAGRAGAAAPARRRATLGGVGAVTMWCASRARCSARAPTGCPPRAAAPAVARAAARASPRSTSTRPPSHHRPRSTRRDRRPGQPRRDARPPIASSPRRSPTRAARRRARSGPLAGLRRRIHLTYHYLGWRTLLFRVAHLPAALHAAATPAAAALARARRTTVRRARRLVPRARRAR